MPQNSEYHVDAALSNFASTERFNGEDTYVASIIAPVLPVKKKSDVFYKFTSDYINTDVDDASDQRAQANEISWNFTTDNYSCKNKRLKKFSTQDELDNADDVVLVDQRDALHVKERLLLSYERRVQALAVATLNVTTPSAKWDAVGTTTILDDIVTAKEAFRKLIGKDPTHILLDSFVADKISIQTEIKDIIKYILAATGNVNDSLIAIPGSQGALPKIFLGMKPVIPGCFYNPNNPNQTRGPTRVWGKDAYLFYIDPTQSIESATWAKTFMYTNLTMWQYPFPGLQGRYVEGYWTLDEKETLSGAIHRLAGVIS